MFFKRSQAIQKTFKCLKYNDCLPTKDFTFQCKQCRYNVCMKIGMSREHKKIGRYSRQSVSLVPEARGGPFVFWDDLAAAAGLIGDPGAAEPHILGTLGGPEGGEDGGLP